MSKAERSLLLLVAIELQHYLAVQGQEPGMALAAAIKEVQKEKKK